jgi:hypothetical protein
MVWKQGFKTCSAFLAFGAVLSVFAVQGSALAWGDGGDLREGNPCYVKVKPKIIYRTFRRRILIREGSYETVYTPPLYGEVVRSSVFGTGDRGVEGVMADDPASGARVLLKPYRNIAIYHPARYRWITERVAIQPEGYVWRRVSRCCCR